MTSKGVIAGVAVIAIVLIAAGTYLLSNNGNSDFSGTYVFQQGTYAEVVDGEVVYYPWTDDDDIVIESCYGNVFSGKWGNDPFIGNVDEGCLQIECVYKDKEGTTYSTIGYGYLSGNALYYSANVLLDNGTSGAMTATFAKKGTTVEVPAYEGILKKGQVFTSYKIDVCKDDVYSDESKTSKLTVTVKDYNNGLYILEEIYDNNGTLYPNTTIAVHKYSNLLVCGYEDGSIGCLTCTSDTILGHYDFYMNGSHNVIACEMSTSGTGTSSVPDLSGKVYEGKSYGLDSSGKRTEIAYSVSFGANHGNLFDVLYVYNGITYTMTAAVAYDSIDKGYYVTTTDVYTDDRIGLIANYYFGYVSKDLKHYYDDIPEYWIEGGYATYYSHLNLTDKVGFLGTYTFQKGAYAKLSGTDVEYIPYLTDADIVIESYDGKNFYGHWGSHPLIGAYDGSMIQFECVYDDYDKEYRSMGYGYIDGNALYYGANDIAKDGTIGAFTTVFAKKGTTVEIPEFKGIVEKGQEFKAFEFVYSIDGEFIEIGDTTKETISVLDVNNGIYVLKDEGHAPYGVDYSYVGLAVQSTSNTMVCIFGSGYVGYFNCTGDRMEASMSSYWEGTHSLESVKLSSSGSVYEVPVPDISGKVYEGAVYTIENNGIRTEHKGSISFGDNNGSQFYVLFTYDDASYTLLADVTFDDVGKGYYVTCSESYSYESYGTIYGFTFGYITKDLKTYFEQSSEFAENGIYASHCCELSLTDKIGFLGTYEFQGGTYAEIINNQIEYRSWTGEDDITIYSYDGINFYGKWGEDPFIGSFDGEYMQIECVYKENGSLYSTLGFGYIDNGTLCFGADLITDDSIPGAFTAVFAKKGTKATVPEFKPILEKGQTFESYECNICIDGEFKSASSDYVNRITVLDANNGVYLLKDEGVNMFGQYQYLTIAVQRAQNTIVCVYDDVSFGSITCSSGYIDAFYDYYVDGRHVISSYKLSETGEYREYSVPVLAGKKYEGTLSMVSNANYWGVFDYTLTFGANHGSLYEVQIAWAGTSYKILANIVYDDANKGYHLTAVEDKITDDVGIVLDYTFGYISEDLKTYTECTSTYTSFGVDYAFCGTLKLAE